MNAIPPVVDAPAAYLEAILVATLARIGGPAVLTAKVAADLARLVAFSCLAAALLASFFCLELMVFSFIQLWHENSSMHHASLTVPLAYIRNV